jgi:hypothetical protein
MAVWCGNCSHGFCEGYALVEILSSNIFASVHQGFTAHDELKGINTYAVFPHCIQQQSLQSDV